MKGLDDILQRLEFGLHSSALALTKRSVRPTRGQCLVLLAADVRSAEEVNGLDDDGLRKSVGAETAALLRPKTKGAE